VTVLPRSLFGRLTLLLIAVVALAVLASVILFRVERTGLINRQLSETKVLQLQAIRAALAAADDPERSEALEELSREYGVTIQLESDRPVRGQTAGGPFMRDLAERLREQLGPETDIRFAPRLSMLYVRVVAGDTPYWIGVPVPRNAPADDASPRALIWLLVVLALLLTAAYGFARYLARPLRQLTAAVGRVGRGESAPPLPETGPSEIAAVNRGFNTMAANLRRIEEDRALLLAGVSHDLRTPLARLRLGIEMTAPDDGMREGLVADIEEMDRIIGQFLDFARSAEGGGKETVDLNAVVAASTERYLNAGSNVTFTAGNVPPLVVSPTAISRVVANLIDNALAYGAPPVEVTTSVADRMACIEVADHGPGIAASDIERLKQPFTRSTPSRSRADGAAGAGLGLAIVDRIARTHGGTFDLVPRTGGGLAARVRLPLRPIAARSSPP
jgi:two-component system osmolarity sensor histidine kinase EnvZ